MHADFTALEIDLLVDAAHDADLQIDRAVAAERGDKRTGLRVQLDETVPGRNEYDAVVAPAIAPVREATPRQLSWRKSASLALSKTLRPNQLTGLRVQRHNRAACTSRRVEHTVDHQRRALEFVFRERAEGIGLEPPCDLELPEVRSIDLAERRVPRASQVTVVVRPLAILCRWLSMSRELRRDRCSNEHLTGNAEPGEADTDEPHCRQEPDESLRHDGSSPAFALRARRNKSLKKWGKNTSDVDFLQSLCRARLHVGDRTAGLMARGWLVHLRNLPFAR